jgi:hypothetical protein
LASRGSPLRSQVRANLSDAVAARAAYAAFAGMSAAGITVSEDNLDNSLVSFDGMSWPCVGPTYCEGFARDAPRRYRLRDVLANAANLHEAMTVHSDFNYLLPHTLTST